MLVVAAPMLWALLLRISVPPRRLMLRVTVPALVARSVAAIPVLVLPQAWRAKISRAAPRVALPAMMSAVVTPVVPDLVSRVGINLATLMILLVIPPRSVAALT